MKLTKKLFSLVFVIILLATGLLVYLNYQILKDYFTGLSYAPSAEMTAVKEKLSLTDRADLIFKASFPVLEAKEEFNLDCDSHDSEISVLGCFTNEKIYVYDIKSSELSGIIESTTAHELLHAIWFRLSGAEKAALTPLLESVYDENVESLKDTLENYEAEDRLDELYVRVGTQIPSLPEELEVHYQKYFENRASLVEFYENYIAPFNELKAKIDALEKELESLKTEIDSETAEYESRAEKFNSDVYNFNACANTVNCYTEFAFYARRAELVAEEKNLNLMFENLDLKVSEYNTKVEEYNKNVLKSNNLQKVINSNSVPSLETEN